MAEEESGEEKKLEVKKEETIKTKETFTKVENSENEDFSFFDDKLFVALITLVIGLIIGYYVIPKILELISERQAQDDYIEYWPSEPPVWYYQHRPHHEERVASPPLHRRRSAIDPLAEMRTPDSLRKHGIILDEKGEAILMDQTVYETWNIERDLQGKIVDAHKVSDNEFEYE